MDAWIIVLFSHVQKPFSRVKETRASSTALGGKPETSERLQASGQAAQRSVLASADGQGCSEHPNQGTQITARASGHPSGTSLSSKAMKSLVEFNVAVSWTGKKGARDNKTHLNYSLPGITVVIIGL